MTILYYSSTGNSRFIAHKLAYDGDTVCRLDKCDAVIADDIVGVVVPTQCGDVPPAARRMIDRLDIKARYIFAVVTYGYTPGRTLKRLSYYLPRLDYGATIAMPDSCLTLRDPVKESKRLDTLDIDHKVSLIAADIHAGKSRHATCSLVDNLSDFFGRLVGAGKITHTDLRIDTSACIGCGLCVRICPAGNIHPGPDGKPSVGSHCEGCMTCVNRCPRSAIHCSGEKSGIARYRHPSLN